MDTISEIAYKGFYYNHHHSSAPQNETFVFHCHDLFEIYYFISGDGDFEVEGNSFSLKEESLIILRQNEFHHFILNSQENYERCTLHFKFEDLESIASNEALLSPFLDRALGEKNQFMLSKEDSLSDLFNRFDRCASLPLEEKMMRTQFILGELLTVILNMSRRNQFTDRANQHESIASSLQKHINFSIDSQFSLDDLAKKFFVSKYYLCHTFKKHTGVSILEYILKKKVLIAAQHIKNGTKANKAAELSGFGSYSAFLRAYKRIIGTNPTMRKTNRPDPE